MYKRQLVNRTQYLSPLNRAYNTNFENLEEYKQENNFKKLLRSLTLEHVRQAVKRSKDVYKRQKLT